MNFVSHRKSNDNKINIDSSKHGAKKGKGKNKEKEGWGTEMLLLSKERSRQERLPET